MASEVLPITSSARHMVPAVYRWFSENDQQIYVTFAVDVKTVTLNPCPNPSLFNEIPIHLNEEVHNVRVLTLNTATEAVKDFSVTEEGFFFSCRFTGTATEVFIPFASVLILECKNVALKQAFGVDPSFIHVGQVKDVVQKSPVPAVDSRPRSKLTLVK